MKRTTDVLFSILTPLTFASAAQADVVINELLGSTTSTDTEFVELYNSGIAEVDISNWTLTFYDSDFDTTSFGGTDGGSPFTIPAGTVLAPNTHYLFGNAEFISIFGITPDVALANNFIENGSYTAVLADSLGTPVNVIFVVDADTGDLANIDGLSVTPDTTIGPDGTNLPAGFTRDMDGGDSFKLLEFSPRPAESATPTSGGNTNPTTGIVASIMEIQGQQHTSPLLGELVETAGVVTAVDTNGFYLQDSAGDGDLSTSDALFVFTGSSPDVLVGDALAIEGTVSEFTPGGSDTRNLSTTQLSSATFEVVSSGNALPAPIMLGAVGRSAPTENIDDDAFGSFDPDTDGIDFFESVEAMRVTIPSPLVVGPTNRFGEIFTVADSGAGATGISSRQTLNISENDFNPEKVQIDEDSGILPGFDLPDVNSGAQLSDVTGVVGYGFGNFEVYPTESFSVVESSPITPQMSSLAGSADAVSIASYNVLNLDINEADGDTDVANNRFATIAGHIVNNLNSPDIIGLQEIQDNDGSDGAGDTNADTSASLTLQTLADEIAAAGGPVYEFADTEGLVPDSVGGQPGGNIRVAFLFNPARVSLVGSVIPLVDPADQASNPLNPFFGSRISLAADFNFAGTTISVVNNHLSSKGGSAPILGIEQPFDQRQEEFTVNGSLDERQVQATAVRDYVAGILALNSEANVVVLGDMNEFEFVSPVAEVLGRDLVNLVDSIDDNERYSFIFQGNSQQLDHLLVSPNLFDTAEFDIVNLNSEFAELPTRGSDHDPLLTVISFDSGNMAHSADLNDDGTIDRRDYKAFLRTYRSKEGQRRYREDADYNPDGRINKKDLKLFLELYWVSLDNGLIGDIDRDGDRDSRDRRLLRYVRWSKAGQVRYLPEADIDRNLIINRRDLKLFDQL